MSPSFEIPKTQLAAVVAKPGPTARYEIQEIPVSLPKDDEILVRIEYSGVCFSDLHLLKDEWATCPMTTTIGGHEGAGTVVAVGKSVENFKVGDRAGLKWVAAPCQTCSFCLTKDPHMELWCLAQEVFGCNVPGTFQQYTISKAFYASHLPDGISMEEAAPLLCGGVTSYASLLKCSSMASMGKGMKPGDWLAVSGAGGGLGHLAVQYGKSMGYRVLGIDDGSKRDFVLGLGAEKFFDYRDGTIVEQIRELTGGGVKGVTVTSHGNAAYKTAADIVGFRGCMVCVGLPKEDVDIALSPRDIIDRSCCVVGSNVGTLDETEAALQYTIKGLVKPLITKCTMSQLNDMVDALAAGKISGRIVCKMER